MQGGATNIDGFDSNYKKLTAAKGFSRLGYIAIALDVGSSAAQINAACTAQPGSAHCEKAKYSETGRAGGSIAGGLVGGGVSGWIGAGVCSLIFGAETGGLAILACIAAFGVAGGYTGSKYTSALGREGGNFMYELRK